MKTKKIKQSVTFSARPADVYALLMDARKHKVLTGASVTMSKKVNGKFSVFDGYCHGYNLELVEGKKIVQAWHFEEDGWPEDHFSICTFLFTKSATGTKLSFEQKEVPEHKVDALKEGLAQVLLATHEGFSERCQEKEALRTACRLDVSLPR